MSNIDLSNISEEELLGLRICELPLKIEETWLQDCIDKLYKELDNKDIKFKPPCYLADEWLTPDGEPVIGVPFYLANPQLTRLEKKMMIEAEGDTKQWCMQLLRHETGHAINYAYKLYKKRKWQKIFGIFSQEYEDTYRFRPYSKNFVRHLKKYYAQYHPDEDFAETFAIWLTPDIDWQNQYKGWKVIQKLRYVDELMNNVKDKELLVKKGKKYWQASRIKAKLENHYKSKKRFHAEDFPDFHDANLKNIFKERSVGDEKLPLAHDLIKRYKKSVIDSVSNWTGEKKYVIDDLLRKLIMRCKDLKLVVADPEDIAVLRISVYVTALITNYLYTGKMRGER